MTLTTEPLDSAILRVLKQGPLSRQDICTHLCVEFKGESSPIDNALQKLRKSEKISFHHNKWWIDWTNKELEEMKNSFVKVSFNGVHLCTMVLKDLSPTDHEATHDYRRLFWSLYSSGYTITKDTKDGDPATSSTPDGAPQG